MKRLFTICVLAASVALFAMSDAQAHPPIKLVMSYKAAGGVLKIDLDHPVGDRSEHFIEEVTVMTEDREAARLSFIQQMTRQGQSILVTVGFLEEGAKVTVQASCNKFGELEKTGVVPGDGGEEFLELD